MSDYTSMVDNLGGDDHQRAKAWDDLRQAESEAIPALIQGLLTSPTETGRVDCVRLLEKLTDPRIDAAFLEAMRHDSSMRVRGHCVKAISTIDDDEVVEAAVELLLAESVPAADRLRRGPQSYKTIALLNQRLAAATTPEGRTPVFKALMQLGSPETYDQYIDWLDHAEPDYRLQAAEALERHAYVATEPLKQAAYDRLLERVPTEAVPEVQARMITALGSFRRNFETQAYDLLTGFLDHEQDDIAKAAQFALKLAGYEPENKQLRCAVCNKSQPERKVEKCKICEKPVCEDHWVRDPLGSYFFCSQPHEQEFTSKQGIDYWK